MLFTDPMLNSSRRGGNGMWVGQGEREGVAGGGDMIRGGNLFVHYVVFRNLVTKTIQNIGN